MKKREFVSFFILVFLLIISISLASALEKTKIYGAVDPNENVKLFLTYTANSVNVQNQLITTTSDSAGNWEYKISTDPGTIDLKIAYKNEEKEFSVITGQDFEVNWNGEMISEVEETNTTTEENTTTEAAEEVAEEPEETNTEETASGSSGITGKSILGDIGEIKMPDNWKTYLIIIAVFIAMIIANILAVLILGFLRKSRENRKSGPSKEDIRVVKLSERLAQIKAHEEEVQRALEEARRNK